MKDGGPLFPQMIKVGEVAKSDGGATLRDYLAAHVITGHVNDPDTSEKLAAWAYEVADAMIAEREKGEKT